MWKKIKDWIFVQPHEYHQIFDQTEEMEKVIASDNLEVPSFQASGTELDIVEQIKQQTKLYQAAIAHYCSLCNRGFKTVGATNAHKSIKHKDVSIHPTIPTTENL